VIALKKLGELKEDKQRLVELLGKFVGARVALVASVYLIALAVAYLVPAYRVNPFLVYGLPLGMVFSALFLLA